MKHNKLFLFVLFVIPLKAFSLETDNYLVWDKKLPDSGDIINEFIADKVQEALSEANRSSKKFSCEDITFAVADQFKTTPTKKSLEDFVNESLDNQYKFPQTPDYLDISILEDTRFYLKYSGLSPNIQIKGYYFGSDKLSHFASTGRRYFNYYLDKIKASHTEEEAVKAAVRFGLMNEVTVLGWWASGVYSYGDVEANYQGFLFYRKLCHTGKKNYLSQDAEGKWHLKKKPDLRDYVSGHWDETYNLSYFTNKLWPKVKERISRYCDQKDSDLVKERFKYYEETSIRSLSLEYIKKLKAENFNSTPIPERDRSVEELCKESAPFRSIENV